MFMRAAAFREFFIIAVKGEEKTIRQMQIATELNRRRSRGLMSEFSNLPPVSSCDGM